MGLTGQLPAASPYAPEDAPCPTRRSTRSSAASTSSTSSARPSSSSGPEELHGPLPVPRREVALLLRLARARHLALLRLRRGRRHLLVRAEARQPRLPRSAPLPRERAGVPIEETRGPTRTSARSATACWRSWSSTALYYRGTLSRRGPAQRGLERTSTGAASRPSTARSVRARLQRRSKDRGLERHLTRAGYGIDECVKAGALGQTRGRPPRLRPFPRPRHLPDPRRRWPRDRRLAGGRCARTSSPNTSTRLRTTSSTRAATSTPSTRPATRSASRARRSSSRGTWTP